MTWTPITRSQVEFARHLFLWVRTAKAAGYPPHQPDWLPSDADVSKSALLERIRSGKKPLPEPPPVAHACPWYAVVEDPGPHWVGGADGSFSPRFHDEPAGSEKDAVSIYGNPWRIYERREDSSFIVGDGVRATCWRFRLHFDPDWKHPSGRLGPGGWFLTRCEEKECERIAEAALRLPPAITRPNGDRVVIHAPPPARHHNLIAGAAQEWGEAIHDAEGGFLTTRGRFVDRKEACVIARAACQIMDKHGSEDFLFSEDIW